MSYLVCSFRLSQPQIEEDSERRGQTAAHKESAQGIVSWADFISGLGFVTSHKLLWRELTGAS
jgi:hypothetical protein